MSDLNRRDVLQILGATPAAVAITWNEAEAAQAAQQSQQARKQAAAKGQAYKPRFFTAREYAVVVALSDLIIPKDDRSPSASQVGTPEFIDHIVSLQSERQTALRGGLVWLDTECRKRFNKAFLECADAERRQVLDDIAFPAKAKPEMSHGVRFFTTMRDLVASGFWSSRAGVKDLGYVGNVPTLWHGAPEAVLSKLGVSYE